MSKHIKIDEQYVPHPKNEGVFMKHFFSKEESEGCLNNAEIMIIPGYQIAPHIHEEASEYFYVVSGSGLFLDDETWVPIHSGMAFKAPAKMVHATKNTGEEVLILFSTFTPPIR